MNISLVIKSYSWAIKSIFYSKKLLGYCLLPCLLGFLFLVFGVLSFLALVLTGYGSLISSIMWFVIFIIPTALVWIILNEWLFEKFIISLIKATSLQIIGKRSLLSQIWDGFIRSIFLLIFSICSLVFGLTPFTQPISILTIALGFGFMFFDTTLSSAGYSLNERLKIINQNLGKLIICGMFFTPTIIFFLASFLLLPIGYASAVYLLQATLPTTTVLRGEEYPSTVLVESVGSKKDSSDAKVAN